MMSNKFPTKLWQNFQVHGTTHHPIKLNLHIMYIMCKKTQILHLFIEVIDRNNSCQ